MYEQDLIPSEVCPMGSCPFSSSEAGRKGLHLKMGLKHTCLMVLSEFWIILWEKIVAAQHIVP